MGRMRIDGSWVMYWRMGNVLAIVGVEIKLQNCREWVMYRRRFSLTGISWDLLGAVSIGFFGSYVI